MSVAACTVLLLLLLQVRKIWRNGWTAVRKGAFCSHKLSH
jgi:hypothetical protein